MRSRIFRKTNILYHLIHTRTLLKCGQGSCRLSKQIYHETSNPRYQRIGKIIQFEVLRKIEVRRHFSFVLASSISVIHIGHVDDVNSRHHSLRGIASASFNFPLSPTKVAQGLPKKKPRKGLNELFLQLYTGLSRAFS